MMLQAQTFDPVGILMVAAINPVVILVALAMGRMADQRQKVVVAAFVASVAGFAALWFAARLGIVAIKGAGSAGGIFVVQCVLGYVWAEIGHWTHRQER